MNTDFDIVRAISSIYDDSNPGARTISSLPNIESNNLVDLLVDEASELRYSQTPVSQVAVLSCVVCHAINGLCRLGLTHKMIHDSLEVVHQENMRNSPAGRSSNGQSQYLALGNVIIPKK